MTKKNKEKETEQSLEDHWEELRKLGARETTHEKEGTTKIRFNFPFRVEPEQTDNEEEE
mgnify:CR=1 FL=1|jgi:hypothetical protein